MLTEDNLPSCARTLYKYWSQTTPKFPVIPAPVPAPVPATSVSEKEFNDLKISYTQLQQVSNSQKNRIADLERERSSAQGRDQDRIKDLETTNVELQQEVKKQQTATFQTMGQVTEWKQRYNQAARQVEERDAKIREWENEFSNVTLENEQLEAQLREVKKQSEAYEAKLAQLQTSSTEELKAQYEERVRAIDNRYRQSRAQWNEAEEKLKDQLRQTETQLHIYEGKYEEQKKLTQFDLANKDRELKLQQNNVKLEEDVARLQRELVQQERVWRESGLKFQQDCKAQYQNVVEENTGLRQQVQTLKAASEQKASLSDQLQDADEKVSNLQAGVEAQRRELERQRQQYSNSLFAINQSLATSQAEAKDLKDRLAVLDSALTQERKASQEYKAEAYTQQATLTNQLSELNRKLTVELQRNESARKQTEELKRSHEIQVRSLQAEREQLRNQLTQISKENDQKLSEIRRYGSQILAENQTLTSRLQACESESADNKKTIQELQTANTTYQDEQVILLRQIRDFKQASRKSKTTEDQLSQCQVNLQEAKAEVERSSEEIKSVTENYETRLAQAAIQKETQTQECEAKVEEATESLRREFQATLEESNATNDELSAQYLEKDSKNRELSRTVNELRERASRNETAVNQLNDLIATKSQDLQACQERLQRTILPAS